MLLRGRGSMPRQLGFNFLPIKDPLLRKLVFVTNEYYNERNFEEALVGFQELYHNAYYSDEIVKNHVAIMYANCLSRLARGNNYLHFKIENNDQVKKWLSDANGNYPKSLLEGLTENKEA